MAFFEPETPPAEPADSYVDRPPGEEKCWRCGKWVQHVLGYCPACRAPLFRKLRERNHPDVNRVLIHDAAREAKSIRTLLWMFGLFLGTSILQAWWMLAFAEVVKIPDKERERAAYIELLAFEGIDTLLVAIAIWKVGVPPVLEKDRARLRGWVLGLPILGVILAVNFGYTTLLEFFVGKHPRLETGGGLGFKEYPLIGVLALCVQPGMVEEMFFRYLALGHLRKVMSDHEAVWVSGAMFGLAHIHSPLSMPVLILAGAGLGYARVLSGNLALPMFLHALHNAVVTLVGA